MCSDMPYQLNMAHLKDKGKQFTSKFLILSSNKGMEVCSSFNCADTRALSRRISPTFELGKRFGTVFKTHVIQPEWKCVDSKYTKWTSEASEIVSAHPDLNEFVTQKEIIRYATNEYLKRQSFWSENCWKQVISHFREDNLSLDCRLKPPENPLPRVRACVVVESLKARIITTPEAESYCLKPLQMAMFKALQKWKCFEPCWNPDYDLSQLGPITPDKWLLSGDYSSATDNLNYHASQAVMETLKEEFRDLPHVQDWISYEGQKHLVEYGSKTGIPDVVQENGQLMGSLLSFPILSLLNSFTICEPLNCDLESVPALFHGDDIAAQLTSEQISSWKSTAELIGLSLSVGKNYQSKDYVSIDSQLFTRVDKEMIRQKTGKFKLISRNKDQTLVCDKAILNGFNKRQIRTYCSEQLSGTVRSLDIPTEYGGLGIQDEFPDRPITIHEKIVYLSLLEMKSRVKNLTGNLYMVEKGTAAFLKLEKGSHHDIEDDEDRINDELELRRQCTRLHRRFGKYSGFAKFLKGMELPRLRPLSTIKSVITRCADMDLGDLKRVQAARLNVLPLWKDNKPVTTRTTPRGGTDSVRYPVRRGRPNLC
jgi:hypothetical protein